MVNLSVLEQLLNHIRRYTLCKTTDKILLAVSGGVDSMVMLHLMVEAGFKVGVAHCNFQLRGEESMADEALVQQSCADLDIPFVVKHFDTAKHAAAKKISVQMAARELRYEFFSGIIETQGYDAVATAHHFNDSLETSLLNFVRGTGIDGLTGIAPRSGRVIRPLLFATRTMIMDHAIMKNIPWREDASNLTDDYHRNYLRNQVIPRLSEVNPGFEETFRDTMERLAGASEITKAFVREFQSVAGEERDHKLTLDIAKIRQAPAPPVLLWEVIKQHGFNFDQCRQILQDHQPGKLFFSASHQLLVDRKHFIIERRQTSVFNTMTIEKGQLTAGQRPFILSLKEVMADDFRLLKDASVGQFDASRLQFPLIWRKWRAGDYFMPLGMHQEKKLSDFLIDLKIPFNAKADITVLESAGDIVWVVGHRISDRYKVTPDTKRIMIITDGQRQG